MAARKTSRTTPKKPARSSEAATTTTSQRPKTKKVSKKKSASKAGKRTTRRRGRPRVSNTATERVTLRVESDHLQLIDTLVRLKQYSNRSDAVRHANRTIGEYTKMMAEAREQAIDRMIDEARSLGADAVVAVRFQTSLVMTGASEILCYGTAVRTTNS
jgi:uncharacterized protein YbjQ (UPF0145 family)